MNMFQRLRKGCMFMALFFSFFVTAPAWASVILKNGAPIPLELTEEISSEVNKTGQPVKFRVMKDIIVDNHLAVAAGSLATGEITSLRKAGAVGKNGELSMQVKNMYGVDGTLLNITGTKNSAGEEKQTTSIVLTIICCILFLIMKGEKAVFPAGTPVDAIVLGNQSVNGKLLVRGYVPTVLESTPLPQPKKKKTNRGHIQKR